MPFNFSVYLFRFNRMGLMFGYVQDVTVPVPSIVEENGQWMVYFDNVRLLTQSAASFTSAFEAWFSIFWVFSVKYPDALCCTCHFIEKYCLHHSCSVPGVVRRLGEKVM